MKLTTQFVTLLAASSVYGYSIFRRYVDVDQSMIADLEATITHECNKAMEPYEKCMEMPSNLKDTCPDITSDSCVKFFEDPFGVVPQCKGIPVLEQTLDPTILKATKLAMKLMCLKDENGNLCPITEVIRNNQEADLKTIEDTCKSQICTKELLKPTKLMSMKEE